MPGHHLRRLLHLNRARALPSAVRQHLLCSTPNSASSPAPLSLVLYSKPKGSCLLFEDQPSNLALIMAYPCSAVHHRRCCLVFFRRHLKLHRHASQIQLAPPSAEKPSLNLFRPVPLLCRFQITSAAVHNPRHHLTALPRHHRAFPAPSLAVYSPAMPPPPMKKDER
ncbi:hypothetical protein M0R45_036031 [Rubus argutus]|uniref:Uncharacterized protein n=1 Tax=Rubus argutus TaxID=59490 RepID=A0AAW1VZJ7_RUBAR